MTGTGNPGALRVRGGPGGTAARLEDLEVAGARLRSAGHVVARASVRVAGVVVDPAVLVTAPAAPLSWLELERHLTAAVGPPSGAVTVASRLVALGEAALTAVAVYRAADSAADVSLQAIDMAAGRVAGAFLATPVIAAAAVALSAPVATFVGATEVTALAGLLPEPGSDTLLGDVEAAAGSLLLGWVGGHTTLIEHAVDALPGAVGGLLGTAMPWPIAVAHAVPPSVPEAAGWVGRSAGAVGLLRETGDVAVVTRPSARADPPAGVAGVVAGIHALDPDRGGRPGTVRVVAVTRPDGRRAWIVQIPGTQNWSPRAGDDPFDLTGNIHGMAGEPTAARRLVEVALRSAGVRPGEPVLLAGHSQGGLVAAQLAADPAFRASYHVTHVVTVGSPVARVHVPDTVAVLSIEHDEDVVPRLDGAANPDRPGWVTASASSAPTGGRPDPALAHELSSYEATVARVDASDDPGLARWRRGLEPFLAGPGVTAEATEVTGVRATGPAGSPPP